MARTFYDLMMLSPHADREVIAVVYRHLAKRYHPDMDPSPEAEARMTQLNEAYATLSDRSKRSRYDEIIGLTVGAPDETASRGGDTSTTPEPFGEAGPPPPNPVAKGSVLTFGRYRGWALNQLERYDRDYIEWLARTTVGRNYRLELEELLRRRG